MKDLFLFFDLFWRMYGARYGGYGVLYGAPIIKIGEVLDAGVSQILHHLGVKRKTSFHYLGMGPGNMLLQVEPSSLSLSHTPQNRALFFSRKLTRKTPPLLPCIFFLSFYTY